MQSVPISITTNIVTSNPTEEKCTQCKILWIKFVSDLQQFGGFYPGTPVSSTNKTDPHNITEVLLKVALNTITTSI
jgi:hypothetical protein